MDKSKWTDAEIALLREKYPTCGTKIPCLDRSAHQIYRKAHSLGLYRDMSVDFRGVRYNTLPTACKTLGVVYSSVIGYMNRADVTAEQALEYFVNCDIKSFSWQDWEDAVIREEYPSCGSNIEKLSHRSSSAITKRANRLGVKRDSFQSSWDEEDIQLLRQHYEDDCDISLLIDKFGYDSVQRKAVDLGLEKAITRSRWEPWEDSLLREKYNEFGSEIPELLERRSRNAIVGRAHKLGVVHYSLATWSDEEVNILREKYPTCGANIPELSTKTVRSIRRKATECGLSCTKLRIWTDEQVELLKAQYPVKGCEIPELQAVFTDTQIKGKAFNLHIRLLTTPDDWTAEEDALIMEKYPSQGTNIPELVGRPSKSIGKRARRLGVKVIKQASWSSAQLDILKEKYPVFGSDIPELLQVYSRQAIIQKAKHIGIKVEGRNVPWTVEEENIIEENYGKMTAGELCAMLPGRTIASIYAYINKRGMVKEVGHSQTWKDKAELVPKAPPDGYLYVKCSGCGKVFIHEVDSLLSFSHDTHVVAIPDGWFAPVAYTKLL